MKISKIIFLGVLALTNGQDPPDPDTTQPAEPTEERIELTVLSVINSPPLRIFVVLYRTKFVPIRQVLISKIPNLFSSANLRDAGQLQYPTSSSRSDTREREREREREGAR